MICHHSQHICIPLGLISSHPYSTIVHKVIIISKSARALILEGSLAQIVDVLPINFEVRPRRRLVNVLLIHFEMGLRHYHEPYNDHPVVPLRGETKTLTTTLRSHLVVQNIQRL